MNTFRRIIFYPLLFLFSCMTTNQHTPQETQEAFFPEIKKINGASLVASMQPLDDSEFIKLKALSVNYVCLLPFAYVQENVPRVFYGSGHQWWGESPPGISCCIEMAHRNHLQVMIKPQLWVSHGTYTGELKFGKEEDWVEFEKSYSNYIFQLLHIADSLHAELFCLGTELDQFVKQRALYWSTLIDSARKIYSGKLIYASNWNCYEDFPLWNKLDAVGINAYFPLSDAVTPAISELLEKWNPYADHLKLFAEKNKRPILFTEYGYRSIDHATCKPWESYTDGKTNFTAQQNGYEALYQKFWAEPWFAGGFFWKWFDEHTPADIPLEADFTPQHKPAEEVIRKWYGGGW